MSTLFFTKDKNNYTCEMQVNKILNILSIDYLIYLDHCLEPNALQ